MIGHIIGTTIGGLTNHLWQSTLFAVAAGLLTVAFRRNRAQIRYWLWLGASLKFLVPFSLLMSLGSHLQWAPAAKSVATQAVSFTMVQIAQPFPDTLPFAPSAPRATDWLAIAILGVWACGFGAIALVRFRDWLRIRAAVRSSTRLEIPAAIEVRSFPGRMEPGVVGLLRPVLLLPAGVLERLTPPQLTAVLAHELCHVRRRDNLTAAMHMIVEAVFWFHPLVWWIGARLVEERERACDEEVLRLGSEPQVYAESILSVCKFYVESPLTCVSGVTGSDLKKRIQRIMKDRLGLALSGWKKLLLAMAGVVALAVPVAVGVLTAPSLLAPVRAERRSPLSFQLATPDRPRFDVVSVKPNKSGDLNRGMRRQGGRFAATNLPVGRVISVAYQLGPDQMIAGAGWDRLLSEQFDIEAKAEGNPTAEQINLMLQSLLADRFKLAAHRETRQLPVFALVLSKAGKTGPQLTPHADDPTCYDPSAGGPPAPQLRPGADLLPAPCVGIYRLGNVIRGKKTTMDAFAANLSGAAGRTVINLTGLNGTFDLALAFTPATPPGVQPSPNASAADDPSAPPDIFTALQEQLGLKLEAQTGPVDVLVIDHVEEPSPN